MSEFVKTSFDQVLLEPISGSRPKGGVNTEGDIPSLGGENVTMTGGVKFYPVKKISFEFYNSMSRGHLRDLDVLINKDGANTGKSGIYRNSPYQSAAVNEHLFILRGKEGVLEQEYLHYLFQLPSVRAILDTKITGSAQPGLNTAFVQNFPIELAPLQEQKKIASILTSVDEMIENTQKQINKLKDLKKATMNDLLTKGIDHSEFRDSELGRIPKSWKIKTIEELTSKVVDGPHSTPKYVDKGIPFVTVKNITSGEVKFTDLKYITEEDYCEFMRRGKPDLGDILYSKDGSIGHTAIVHTDRKFAYFVSVALLKIRQNLVNSKFINYALQSEYIWRQTELLNEGSGLKHMVLRSIKALKICLPSEEEQRAISQILQSIDKTIHCQSDKLTKTQSLKKSLMQDLLTGNVRVRVN
jgi:type I restriction enzyme S subunit